MWAIAALPPQLELPRSLRLWGAMVLGVIGLAVMFSGVIAFRHAHTTINPLKPETATALVSGGIYSFTRNPMYLGILLVLLAWGVYLASLWVFLGPLLFALYITRFQILPEEAALEKLFGSPFLEYRKRVRRWL